MKRSWRSVEQKDGAHKEQSEYNGRTPLHTYSIYALSVIALPARLSSPLLSEGKMHA